MKIQQGAKPRKFKKFRRYDKNIQLYGYEDNYPGRERNIILECEYNGQGIQIEMDKLDAPPIRELRTYICDKLGLPKYTKMIDRRSI